MTTIVIYAHVLDSSVTIKIEYLLLVLSKKNASLLDTLGQSKRSIASQLF
ncbi:hypothetical protein NARC_40086 [Candidatus Nitrosocosmicus arcticus]|uniref:Uncharacterized protein n=1 Tax=Candidatus Nitrosocosmicus arcticus TaxID=2035267 RepID=A0A557SWZ8_9ARCH|nr:hypothetical protein NARC_40086 [Candidatus Nitrosocosmicus arcticus]